MNKVKLHSLKSFCEQALVKVGVSPENAQTVADENLNQYIQKMQAGGLEADAEPSIECEGPAFAIVNGNKAIGMVSGCKAMKLAIEKAKQCGIAYVGVKNSAHSVRQV